MGKKHVILHPSSGEVTSCTVRLGLPMSLGVLDCKEGERHQSLLWPAQCWLPPSGHHVSSEAFIPMPAACLESVERRLTIRYCRSSSAPGHTAGRPKVGGVCAGCHQPALCFTQKRVQESERQGERERETTIERERAIQQTSQHIPLPLDFFALQWLSHPTSDLDTANAMIHTKIQNCWIQNTWC